MSPPANEKPTSNATNCIPFTKDSTIPFFLDGTNTNGTKTFEVISPVSGERREVLYKTASASVSDVEAAVESAERSLKSWRKTKPAERGAIFLRAAAIIEVEKEELMGHNIRETGADPNFAAMDLGAFAEACRATAALVQSFSGSLPTVAGDRNAMLVNEPYGVVLAIAPWNAPYTLGGRSVLAPLAAGNTVILKGAEAAPATYWAIADVLHKAGLPAGVLNTLIHSREDAPAVTEALIAHPSMKKVSFTGSTAVGSHIAALAGKYLKPVLMELGGKAPSIVCDDADLGVAAQWCALGAFLHGGQICMSTERIIVHESIAESFLPILQGVMDQIYGAGTAHQLITTQSVSKNQALVKDAISKGSKVVYGKSGGDEPAADFTKLPATILMDVTKEMDIYYTESFGPTASIIKVASDEDAIKIANDTEYGLTAAVFSKDLRRALWIASELETGAVHINNMTVHDEQNLPHGGAKKSGWGRFNGTEGLKEWTRIKTVTWDSYQV